MKYGLFIREYNGLFSVEYSSPSVGMTLLATQDKAQAEQELAQWRRMSQAELTAALLTR